MRATATPSLLLLLAACAISGASAHQGELARVRLGLAQQLADRGEWTGALDALEAARRDAPGDPDVLTLRGICLREKGLVEEAEADLQEALRRVPDSARAHSALAVVYEREHKPQDAEREHRRAVELAPGDARYLNNLGYALLLHGNKREAVAVLLLAVRAAPMSARARNNLGFAYALSGDFSRAAQQFSFAGTPAEANLNLGVAYERTGNVAQALEHYRAALRLDPGLRLAQESVDRLAARADPARPALGATEPAQTVHPTTSQGGAP